MTRFTHPLVAASALAFTAVTALAGTAHANVVLYDGGPFATSNPGGFSYSAFTAGLTEGPDSLTIDVDAFGGLGRDLAAPVAVDPVNELFRLVYRVLDNNVADDFRLIIRDNDGDDSAPGIGTEDHQFFVDMSFASPLNDGSGFSEQFVPLNAVFRAKSSGFTNDGDGILNPDMDQWQLQSAFGSTDRLNIEVKTVEIVPEPASAALFAATGLLALRRRRSN